MLYGINTSFPVVSRLERQVAHALLTRPPLSVLLHSVRLECVMHAASVHPEPGSNSRLKSFILAFIYYFYLGIVEIWLYFNFLITSFSYFLCTISSLFNFQRSFAPLQSLLSCGAYLFYHFFFVLSTLFSHFFSKFLVLVNIYNQTTKSKTSVVHINGVFAFYLSFK